MAMLSSYDFKFWLRFCCLTCMDITNAINTALMARNTKGHTSKPLLWQTSWGLVGAA
jgi:hypothetical protein